eukprot:20870-Heterococcus_DN1.PRE.1
MVLAQQTSLVCTQALGIGALASRWRRQQRCACDVSSGSILIKAGVELLLLLMLFLFAHDAHSSRDANIRIFT